MSDNIPERAAVLARVLLDLQAQGCTPALKYNFHNAATNLLEKVATDLGYVPAGASLPEQYRIEHNRGGYGTCGEVVLWTSDLKIEVMSFSPTNEFIMARRLEGRRAYGPETLHFFKLADFQDPVNILDKLQAIVNPVEVENGEDVLHPH
jgi:hypothetical protein